MVLSLESSFFRIAAMVMVKECSHPYILMDLIPYEKSADLEVTKTCARETKQDQQRLLT